MPYYLYECRNCQHEFEIQQSMQDDSISLCPQCHKHKTRRIITKTGIMFKGSGFYVNDKNISQPTSPTPECKKANSSKDSS